MEREGSDDTTKSSITTAATAARQRVFGIQELADAILLLLDVPNSLLASTVCKEWRHMITNSAAVRQHIRLHPLPDRTPLQIGTDKTAECNISARSPWLFRSFTAYGILVIWRMRGFEMAVLAPRSAEQPMRFLDIRRKRVTYHHALAGAGTIAWVGDGDEILVAKVFERWAETASPLDRYMEWFYPKFPGGLS